MTVKRLADVQTCLLWQTLLGLFNRRTVENLISLQIVRQNLLKLVIDLLMQVKQLSIRDLEDSLCVLLAQHFLDLFVQVTHTHEV